MRESEMAALYVLAKAADVYNCWAILDEAVTSGEDDQFTKEYIESEREMLEGSIAVAASALRTLGKSCGIDAKTGNGSYAYMRKVREEHLTELERAKEFDRGYKAGQKAMDAERQAIALKLRGLDLTGSGHENLSKIAYAIYPCATGWTPESCDGLRDKLVRLLGGVNERETTLTTCDVLDNERHKAIAELRKFEPMIGGKPTEETSKLIRCITGKSDSHVACINDLEETRDRIIHLLGGDTCNCDQGGDHGDCAERRRTGAAGGDTDVDEPAEIRAVSNGIADALSEMDAESDADGTCPNDVPTPSITDELREMDNGHSRTCPKSGDEVSESAPSVSIVDELRDCVERATKTYDDAAWYEVDDEDEHTWCSITVAEIDGIADRIEEQFARVCQQQEAVLLKQMDQQRAMLTEQRDAARAKVIALCNECDEWRRGAELDADRLDETKRQRDNLLDLLRDAVVDFKNASYGWNYAAVVSENITIETERNRLAKERDTLQKWLDDMREQREHWADEATKMYRLFFSHDEYCVPDNPSEMVAVAVRTLQAKLDEIKSVLATDETEVSDVC